MAKAKLKRVRGTYGKPWSRLTSLPVTKELLTQLGECIVRIFVEEATKDFAKRGWSPRDPMGGPDIGKSFSFNIRGASTLEITSTFYGLPELVEGDIPERKMVWLTQEAKQRHKSRYKITETERRQRAAKRAAAARKLKTGQFQRGTERRSLVVPMTGKGGQVIFRTAPLKTSDAWIHPAIAKFTFARRAIDKAKKECVDILVEAALQAYAEGDASS